MTKLCGSIEDICNLTELDANDVVMMASVVLLIFAMVLAETFGAA